MTVGGGNARRIFNVTAPASISRLRLANGFTDRGGAIAYNASGLLTVSDCHFDQNTVTVEGGAILLFQGSLLAEHCTFTTDQAAGNGGAIFMGSRSSSARRAGCSPRYCDANSARRAMLASRF